MQDYIFITEISCLNGDRKAKIFLAGTKLFDLLMEKDRTNSSYRLEIHCSYPCTTSLMNYSFFNTMVCEEFQTFPTLNYIFFFFFWNVQFLGKPCHVIPFTLHSSFLCLFWTKWSPVRSKTSSVAQRKRSTPRLFSPMFIFLPALFESGPFCQGYNFAKWISVNIMSCLFAQVEHERWEIVKWNQSTR